MERLEDHLETLRKDLQRAVHNSARLDGITREVENLQQDVRDIEEQLIKVQHEGGVSVVQQTASGWSLEWKDVLLAAAVVMIAVLVLWKQSPPNKAEFHPEPSKKQKADEPEHPVPNRQD